jgi:radical SAM protein with 4Fe4S-binding SPASM domain
LGQEKVREVWINNLVLRKIHDIINLSLEGVCGHCVHQKLCKGNCLAQNYYASKRLTAPFWFCLMADQSRLFPSSRKS